MTVVEALLFVRGVRNRSRAKPAATPVNPPTRSRTAPPDATTGSRRT